MMSRTMTDARSLQEWLMIFSELMMFMSVSRSQLGYCNVSQINTHTHTHIHTHTPSCLQCPNTKRLFHKLGSRSMTRVTQPKMEPCWKASLIIFLKPEQSVSHRFTGCDWARIEAIPRNIHGLCCHQRENLMFADRWITETNWTKENGVSQLHFLSDGKLLDT